MSLRDLTIANVTELMRLQPFSRAIFPVQLLVPRVTLAAPAQRWDANNSIGSCASPTVGFLDALWWGGAESEAPHLPGHLISPVVPQIETLQTGGFPSGSKFLDWRPEWAALRDPEWADLGCYFRRCFCVHKGAALR